MALHNHDTTGEKLMKLSNDTREVLKNFSTINKNLLVKNGTAIGTMSAMKNIVAKATVPDTFNNEFAIYDLNEFLSAMSLFKTLHSLLMKRVYSLMKRVVVVN